METKKNEIFQDSQKSKISEIFKQETHLSCGIACLRSIFSHYGKKLSEAQIMEKHEFYKLPDGNARNPIISLGVTALKNGFKAKYIGYNPVVFNKVEGNLVHSLKEKSSKYKDYWKFCVDKTLELLNLKGEVLISRLNIPKLEKLIDDNGFVLAGIKPSFLDYNAHISSLSHKVIVDSYDKDKSTFHILDPADGKGKSYHAENFYVALCNEMPEVLTIKK